MYCFINDKRVLYTLYGKLLLPLTFQSFKQVTKINLLHVGCKFITLGMRLVKIYQGINSRIPLFIIVLYRFISSLGILCLVLECCFTLFVNVLLFLIGFFL